MRKNITVLILGLTLSLALFTLMACGKPEDARQVFLADSCRERRRPHRRANQGQLTRGGSRAAQLRFAHPKAS
jgi:hypothetical protein